MFEKFKAVLFVWILLIAGFGAQRTTAQTAADGQNIRSKLIDYGTGAKVSVTLRSQKKIVGKIASIDTDTFTVDVGKTKTTETIAYNDVGKVKKGSSNTKWIVIAVAAGIGAAVLIPLSQRCRNEGAGALCL